MPNQRKIFAPVTLFFCIFAALLFPMASLAQKEASPAERQKFDHDQRLPQRKLTSLSATVEGRDYLLTLWDIPCPEKASVKKIDRSNPYARLFFDPRALCLTAREVTKPETNKPNAAKPKAENIVLLTYWVRGEWNEPPYGMPFGLSQASNGRIYLITGHIGNAAGVILSVYEVDVRQNRGQYPLALAPADIRGNLRDDLKPTRPLSMLNTGGAPDLTRFRIDFEDGNLLVYQGNEEKFFEELYLRLDMETKKWVRIYKGQEFGEHGGSPGQSPDYYTDKTAGAVRK